MRDEAERMRWARRWIAVPEVIDQGEDATHEWLVTAALPGRSAVDHRWSDDPETAVRAVGAALRTMHDSLPLEQCPWTWSPESRIANAAARGVSVPVDLREPPPVERLVVCHGDACMPNTARRRRPSARACRPRGPRHGRPLGRHRRRLDEHHVELRSGVGGHSHRGIRRDSRPRAARVLPAPLERDLRLSRSARRRRPAPSLTPSASRRPRPRPRAEPHGSPRSGVDRPPSHAESHRAPRPRHRPPRGVRASR